MCVAVFTVAVLPFILSARFGIVDLDDYWYLLYHDEITGGLSRSGLKFAFMSIEEAIWMPLTWISYMIDHTLFGMKWGFFHLHSVILHGVNAVLAWRLLAMVAGSGSRDGNCDTATWLPAAAAMLWAVHPLRVESVVWIASRKDVLSMMWLLCALLCWGRWSGWGCADPMRTGGGMRGWYVGALGCFLMGAMAKPSVMTFPLLCFIVDYLIRRRVQPLAYLVPLALAGVLGWFAGHAQAVGGATENIFGVPFWYRTVNAAAAFGIYLLETVWPMDLAPQCILRWPGWPRLCVPGLAICGCVSWWLVRNVRRRWLGFERDVKVTWRGWAPVWRVKTEEDPVLAGGLWFALALAPMLGIAGFGYHSMADRFTYIPALGLGIMLVGVCRAISRRRWMLCGMVVATAALAGVSVRQTAFWKDDQTLFSHTIEIDGDGNAPAHGILANWNFEYPHDLKKCVEHFEKAVVANLRFVEVTFQIYVFALCELGREKEVLELLKMFDGWIVKESEGNPKFGKDSLRSKMMRAAYFYARVAYLVTQPDLRKAAQEELDEAPYPKDEPCLLYLKWRLALAEGDGERAEQAKRDLLGNAVMKGYNRFRYLREGGKEGHP